LVFIALLSAYILSQFFRVFLGVIAGTLTRELGLNAAELGAVSAIWFATFSIAQFPVGFLLDRFGPRRTVGGLLMVAVIGGGWFALANSYTDCLVGMALIGIGCSPVLMGSLFVFGRTAPPERFAMLASLMIGLGSFGNLISSSPLAWGVEHYGWRMSLAVIVLLTGLSAAFILTMLKDPPTIVTVEPSSGLWDGIKRICTLRGLWPLMPLTLISYAVVVATRSLWITPFFRDLHGADLRELGLIALMMSIAMTLGALGYGPIERWSGSPRRTTLWGSVITGVSFVVLGLIGPHNLIVALVSLSIIGGAGLTYGILMSHAKFFIPPDVLGRGITFLNFLFIAGAGLIQYGSGQLVQSMLDLGSEPVLAYSKLFMMFGLLLLASTAIYLRSRERPDQ
jgi:MFS family permease